MTMAKSKSFYITYALLFVLGVATGAVSGDETVVIERDNLNLTIPNPFGDIPLLETNDQNGRYVRIYIPYVLDMTSLFRDDTGLMNNLFELDVLSGALHIKYDRMPGQDGGSVGPIKVTVMGIELYDNNQ